jgi:NitT/TauT family transport system ATP-binding protein
MSALVQFPGKRATLQETAAAAGSQPAPAFRFEGLHKTFRSKDGADVVALHDVSFSVGRGEFVTVVGPSGCGKSTLLRILAGLERASRGAVELGGRRHSGPSRDVGVVFQAPVLLPWRNILDNVLVPAQIQGRDPRAARERALHYLHLVGLAGFETKYPGELSGGMQQRVGIARALVNDPMLLLMDEPFGALDAMTRENMNVELLKLRERTGATIMLVTHSIPEAVFLGDRVVVMSPRPGRVTQVIDVDLPAVRTLDLINTERFGSHVREIRANLNASGGLD